MPFINISRCENCGVKHSWLFDAPKLKELREIKAVTGLNGSAFMEAAEDGDPDALAALIYILHKRDRISINFEDVDLDFSTFSIEPTDEEKKAAEKPDENSSVSQGKKVSSRKNGPKDAGD